MKTVLQYGVILSFLISLMILSIEVVKTFFFGHKKKFAEAGGSNKRGIIYALGRGMMPWEKESAKKHLPTYTAGIFYHLGIFFGIFYVLCLALSVNLPPVLIFPGRVLLAVGALSGFVLLIKRMAVFYMRKISCPDDFASNIFVDLFILTALINTFWTDIRIFFYILAIFLFFYMPVGKIRHCFFFFYIRILFGFFYGRRGVLPPAPRIT
ncbi:MAG: hypothetical protein JXB26_18065 [Candidatus Aminicenantes bacterium]|nr:hypothetical protein [Candidatus Aminicenantes bacterium]